MKNISPKLKNIISTVVVFVAIFALAVCCSINFVKHTNFEVKYAVREDLFTIEHISDYSPTIKDTEGDAKIYKNFGKKNSVVLTKNTYETLDQVKAARLCIDNERFAYEAFENGAAMLLDNVDTLTKVDTAVGVENVKSNQFDGFICSYENAKELVKTNSELKICNVEIELFPKILVIGGTHPYEASGFLTATLLLENVNTERGIVYVINEANKAGFNYEQENEARQETFEIPLKDKNGNITGYRTFKIGSRFSHLTEQWPSQDMYMHPQGQQMTNSEARNLNRVYPGNADGNFTERVAYGIYQLIMTNNITMVIDLHEASPEYLTNDKVVYHQDAGEIANYMYRYKLRYYSENPEKGTRIYTTTEESPINMRGLSHRDLGDSTNAYVILCESSDAYEGRLHGALTKDLITYYDHNDKFYEYITNLDPIERNKYVDYWFAPDSIDVRVARHTLEFYSFVEAYNELGMQQRTQYGEYCYIDESLRHDANGKNYTGALIINDIPSYDDIVLYSMGAYLLPVE